MALDARIELLLADSCLEMALRNLFLLVFVAIVTRVIYVSSPMADLTGRWCAGISLAVIQRKNVLSQCRRAPGISGVAVKTFQPKYAGMDFWLRVALLALARSAPERLVRMAVRAVETRMCSIQQEKIGVLEIAQAVCSIMAGQAG